MFYYAGFNVSPKITCSDNDRAIIDNFSEVKIKNLSSITLGWNYLLIWKEDSVFISEKYINNCEEKQLSIPTSPLTKFSSAVAGKSSITLISTDNKIWQYKLYSEKWNKVANFTAKDELVLKIDGTNQNICALTNYGRIYNVPTLLEMPTGNESKCSDMACGFEHTLVLTNNGEVYSFGGGSRGQLGHNDLENSDEPLLIEALAGLKAVKVAAGGWHSAVITSDKDLYTWGWNTNGELGLIGSEKVIAVPTIVDFYNENEERVEENVNVTDVACGNNFTICQTDDGQLWGCGSNKYGQLGLSQLSITSTDKFVRLNPKFDCKNINYFNCREWSTIINI